MGKIILIFIQNFCLTSFLPTLILQCPMGKGYLCSLRLRMCWVKQARYLEKGLGFIHILFDPLKFSQLLLFSVPPLTTPHPIPTTTLTQEPPPSFPLLCIPTVIGQHILNVPIYPKNRMWCDCINLCIACWKLDTLTSAMTLYQKNFFLIVNA